MAGWKVLVYQMEETVANIGSDALTERRVEPNDIPLPVSACLLLWYMLHVV